MSMTPTAAASFTFDAPLPPAELSPNARGHYMKKARIMKAYRADVGWCARAAKPKGWPADAPGYTLALRFWHTTNRGRDQDNAIASAKGAIDSMTDAGLWADDKLVSIQTPIEFGVDKMRPRLEITVTAQTKGERA